MRALIGLALLLGCFLIAFIGFSTAGISDGTVAAILVIGSGLVLIIAAFIGGARSLILRRSRSAWLRRSSQPRG